LDGQSRLPHTAVAQHHQLVKNHLARHTDGCESRRPKRGPNETNSVTSVAVANDGSLKKTEERVENRGERGGKKRARTMIVDSR
jgi:hypothetical protein